MTITWYTIKLVRKESPTIRSRLCLHQLKYLGYLKLIGSGYNWCHWSPIRWDPCGALNLDVQDVYANGCTVNGTVHPSHTRGGKGGTSILISIEVISCFGAREYTSWNLNLLWSVGKLGSTDVNSNAALHGEIILALWDLVCYFKCILNFEILRELGNEICWNAKYKRCYNATRWADSWGDLGDWSAGFPVFQVQCSHWFLCCLAVLPTSRVSSLWRLCRLVAKVSNI